MAQEKLFGTLLRAALEQAAADRGFLILWWTGEPRIVAEAVRRGDTIVVHLRDEAVPESQLPEWVLHYLQRTRENLFIDHAADPATSAVDPYLRRHRTGSILCLPLFNQGEVVGVLVLENHVGSGMFAPARITALKQMSPLAAMALEDSRLYGNLQEREAKIRRLVDANIIAIYTIDLEGQILEANNAFLRMVGYGREDLISGGLRWTDLTPPEWRAADARRVERVRRIGRLQPFEKEYFRRDGTRVPVLVGVARFQETRNQAVVFAVDMSPKRHTKTIASDARGNEGTRIAQDVPDALLQNFQGLMYQFQAARNLMPRNPDAALQFLDDAIHDGEKALDESRDAIQRFRSESIAKGVSRTC